MATTSRGRERVQKNERGIAVAECEVRGGRCEGWYAEKEMGVIKREWRESAEGDQPPRAGAERGVGGAPRGGSSPARRPEAPAAPGGGVRDSLLAAGAADGLSSSPAPPAATALSDALRRPPPPPAPLLPPKSLLPSSLAASNSPTSALANWRLRTALSSWAMRPTGPARSRIALSRSRRDGRRDRASKRALVRRRRVRRTRAAGVRSSRRETRRARKPLCTARVAAREGEVRRIWSGVGGAPERSGEEYESEKGGSRHLVQRLEEAVKDGVLGLAEEAHEGVDRRLLEQALGNALRLVLQPVRGGGQTARSSVRCQEPSQVRRGAHQTRMASSAGLTQKASRRSCTYSATPSCCHSLRVAPQPAPSASHTPRAHIKMESNQSHAQLPRLLARVRKVAQERQRKLLEGRAVLYDALQERDGARRGCVDLAGLAEPAQVEEGVDGVVLDVLLGVVRCSTRQPSGSEAPATREARDALRRGARGASAPGSRRASRSRRRAAAGRARRATSTGF